MLVKQRGQLRYQHADQNRLGHVVVRPDQDQHAIAAVDEGFQVPGIYPGFIQRLVQQRIEDAAKLTSLRIGSPGRPLDIDRHKSSGARDRRPSALP